MSSSKYCELYWVCTVSFCEPLTTGHWKAFLYRVGINAHGRVVTSSISFVCLLLQCLQVTVCAGQTYKLRANSAQENLNFSWHADIQCESSDHPQTRSMIHSLLELSSRSGSMQVSETVSISKVIGEAQDTPCLRKHDGYQDYWPHRCSRRKGFTTSQSTMF